MVTTRSRVITSDVDEPSIPQEPSEEQALTNGNTEDQLVVGNQPVVDQDAKKHCANHTLIDAKSGQLVKRWRSVEEETLVNIYSHYYVKLENTNCFQDRGGIWDKIVQEYNQAYPTMPRTKHSIQDKWKAIWNTYRSTAEHNHRTGVAPKTCPHYDTISAFVKDDPAVIPQYTVDTFGVVGGLLAATKDGSEESESDETGSNVSVADRKRSSADAGLEEDIASVKMPERKRLTKAKVVGEAFSSYMEFVKKRDEQREKERKEKEDRIEERRKAEREQNMLFKQEMLEILRVLIQKDKDRQA